MPRNLNSSLMKPFVVLAIPGMYLFYKYNQYKRQQQEQNRRKVTEKELAHLNHKIDKLLTKLDEHEPELATSQEEECVICITARATMQTFPCGHRVVCRKCFVKTIQTAVAQRMLPLRCVICRAKILRLKQSGVSPSPSEASSLSAFSACSSSFSLASFKTLDSTGSRPSSCASTRSAPPLLLYHTPAATPLRPRSCSPPSPRAVLSAPRTRTSSAGKGRAENNNNNNTHHNHHYHNAKRQQKQQQYVDASTAGSSSYSPDKAAAAPTSSSPPSSPINYCPHREGKASKEKPAVSNRYKSRSSPKLQSLPKVTVRSRSPHKLQLHMHKLEIIKEVE